jgi:S-adenosylmethionine hydrolase
VGSARRALALRVRVDGLGDQHWLGPDNGVLSLVLAGVAESEAIELEPARFVSATPSATFHGRDVFAPAAARLAHGAALASLGAALTHAPVRLAWPETTRVATSLRGRVVHVDRFGNLISNLTRADLAAFAFECGVVPVTGLRVRLDVAAQPNAWLNLGQCYADVPAATALALFGSSELLEVAVANGHAADLFGVGVGAEVTVEVRS